MKIKKGSLKCRKTEFFIFCEENKYANKEKK